MPHRPLTVYGVRESVDGVDVTDFDHVIDPTYLNHPALKTYDLGPDFDFEGRLYVLMPDPGKPPWLEFLRQGFPDIDLVETATNRAVLVVRVNYYGKDRYFALTFGAGRYLLRRNSFGRGYGLRVALNVIYEDDTPGTLSAPTRIRRVNSKTVRANTIRTSRQTNRYATFETFGVDTEADLLSGVTGTPPPSVRGDWGTRLTGSDSLHLNYLDDFSKMGALCRQIWFAEARKKTYQVRFSWLDNVRVVESPALLARLHNQVVRDLREEKRSLSLAPPELIEWDEVKSFRYRPFPQEFADLELDDYLELLKAAGQLETLSLKKLRHDRVIANDEDGNERYAWTVLRCLDGEARLQGKTYLLEAGDFYLVATEYLTALDDFVSQIQESDVVLPASRMETVDGKRREITEGKYNEEAAQRSSDFCLMDKKTVRVTTHTSPIEVCDILTRDRRFIHVKRKLQSASLSHLFAQGYVSGDLFVGSEEYREAVRDAIEDRPFRSLIPRATPQAGQYEVVYAIVARWNGRSLAEALPFFSKINLRRNVRDLRRMGYRVTYKSIPVN